MTWLSAQEMAMMRAAQDDTFDATCDILTSASSQDSIGEAVLTWSTAAMSVACRLRPRQRAPGLETVGEQMQTVADWVLAIGHGGTLSPGDRVVVDNDTYEVIQTWDEETWRTALRADLKRVEA